MQYSPYNVIGDRDFHSLPQLQTDLSRAGFHRPSLQSYLDAFHYYWLHFFDIKHVIACKINQILFNMVIKYTKMDAIQRYKLLDKEKETHHEKNILNHTFCYKLRYMY